MLNDAGSRMHNSYHFRVNQQRSIQYGHEQTTTVKLLNGDVAFRVVCPVSLIGHLFGTSGAISSICQETKCKIHSEGIVHEAVHRVVVVIGSGSIDRRILFRENIVIEECGEVSALQEAVIRVFERMWELEAQVEDESRAVEEDDDVVYCGLLVNTKQIGVVVGKRGKNVTRMRRESGAKIVMLPPPICAAKDDELIQITGGTLAVKKALVAVTACLQDLSPMGKQLTLLNRPIEKVHSGNSPIPLTEFFPHLSLGPSIIGTSVKSASAFHSPSADASRVPSLDTKGRRQEIAFRLLFSDRATAGIIGRRGAIVRSLQNVSGALISFAAPLTKSGERVVTISALENLDTQYSSVQNAVLLVFARSVEVEGQQGFSSRVSKGATVTARLLVGADFVGCLTGNRNRVVSVITDITDADIQLLGGEQILDSAVQNDVLIQISGAYKNVQNALCEVTGRLRHNLLSSKVLNEARLRRPDGRVGEINPPVLNQSVALTPNFKEETIGIGQFGLPLTRSQCVQTKGRRLETPTKNDKPGSSILGGSLDLPTEVLDEVGTSSHSGDVGETICSVLQQPSEQGLDSSQQYVLMEGVAQLGFYDNIGDPSILQSLKTEGRGHVTATTDGERGSTTFAGGVELESGNKSVFFANTTLKTVIGERVLGFVYGEDRSNLARLKEISGAEVEVCEPCPGKSEGMVFISGTPDQTRVARHLLQAFMEGGE